MTQGGGHRGYRGGTGGTQHTLRLPGIQNVTLNKFIVIVRSKGQRSPEGFLFGLKRITLNAVDIEDIVVKENDTIKKNPWMY